MKLNHGKEVLAQNIQKFRPIKLTDLKNPITRFDLYLEVAGRAVLYAPNPYTWSESEKDRLISDGHVVLFYAPSADHDVNRYLTEGPASFTEDTNEPSILTSPVSALAAEFSQILYRMPLDGIQLARVKGLSQSLVQSIIALPQSMYGLHELVNHDSFTFYHSARVAAYATLIAQKMGLTQEKDLADIALGSVLHDLGHLKIEPLILEKSGQLTEREWDLMRRHPEWSFEMVDGINLSFVTSEIIRHHHERIDGKGYPHGIGGAELIKEVRIVTFCDIFDALTSRRPYQKVQSFEEAIAFMEEVALDYIDRDSLLVMREVIADLKQIKDGASATRP